MTERKPAGKALKDDTMVSIYVDKDGKTVVTEKPIEYRTLREPKRKRGKHAA